MLAGSNAGQELNYLLSVGADISPNTSNSEANSITRRSTIDVPDGHVTHGSSGLKSQAADAIMKHVDVFDSLTNQITNNQH